MSQDHNVAWTDPEEVPVQLVRSPQDVRLPRGAEAPAPPALSGPLDDQTPPSRSVPPPPPRAAEISDDYMLRRRSERPSRGWQRFLYDLSGGLVKRRA